MSEHFGLESFDKGDENSGRGSIEALQRSIEEREHELSITNPIQFEIAMRLFPKHKESPEDKDPMASFDAYIASGISERFRVLLERDADLKDRMMKGHDVIDEIIKKISQ